MNDKMKHTPGPWTYSTHERGWSYTINIAQAEGAAYTPDYSDVAWSTCSGEKQAIQEANARLIASAPDLLEACNRLLVCMSLAGWENDDAAITARAAIAKAIGEQA